MPGFYTRFVEVPPGVDEHQGYNLQFGSLFTADPTTDFLTTNDSLGLITAEVVILTTTGILPAPLQPFKYYRVVSPGSTTLQLADNEGWNPPPPSPPVDIVSAGTGIHSLWVRPLDYVGTFITSGGNMTTELVAGAGTSGCRYWGNPPRARNSGYRFQVGSPPPAGLVANTDYNTGEYTRPPVTPLGQWSVAGMGAGAYSGNLYAYADGTILVDGLGDLGSVTTERYYMISGDVITIGGGGGGGGGAGEGGGQPLTIKLPRPTIKVRDPELSSLIRRARRAAQAIENLSIVGDGVSGDSSRGFAITSDD
jgi:hypothetical protein